MSDADGVGGTADSGSGNGHLVSKIRAAPTGGAIAALTERCVTG